jgi:hypothetical protein
MLRAPSSPASAGWYHPGASEHRPGSFSGRVVPFVGPNACGVPRTAGVWVGRRMGHSPVPVRPKPVAALRAPRPRGGHRLPAGRALRPSQGGLARPQAAAGSRECRARLGLHVAMDHVSLEILDGNGVPVTPGEEGEVVVTSLSAFAMPFIRYRLGDVSRFLENACRCGISFPRIVPPPGRADTTIRLPSGGIRSPLGLQCIVLRSFAHVDRYRLIQERTDHLVVQLVVDRNRPRDFPELRRHVSGVPRRRGAAGRPGRRCR